MPSASAEELATAITQVVDADAKVINLSAAILNPSPPESTDWLSRSTVRQGARCWWSQPQATRAWLEYRHNAAPLGDSGGRVRLEWQIYSRVKPRNSIGRRGLAAPGENITSLGTDGKARSFGGTGAAAPFVTGAIALLWSEFPRATASQIKLAVTHSGRHSRSIMPPLLDASAAYEVMSRN